MLDYIRSILSPKHFIYRYISLFAFWDKRTKFSKTTALGKFSRCFNVVIGNYSSIRDRSRVMNCVIGNYSVIAKDCEIGLGVHPTHYLSCHSIFYKNSPWGFHPEWVKPMDNIDKITHVGHDVWIGAKSIIMDGVSIGNGAIIAAGSVVTKDVPPYAVMGGAPAKIIKYKFQQDVINRLEEIQWWNLPDEEITKRVELFHIENPTLDIIDHYFPIKKADYNTEEKISH